MSVEDNIRAYATDYGKNSDEIEAIVESLMKNFLYWTWSVTVGDAIIWWWTTPCKKLRVASPAPEPISSFLMNLLRGVDPIAVADIQQNYTYTLRTAVLVS